MDCWIENPSSALGHRGAAIVTALLLQPPAHWVDWIPVLGYAWGQGASTLRNVQMRIWLLPATALWLVFAAVTAVWPIVLLESMTFMVNLNTIDRLTRTGNQKSLAPLQEGQP